MFASLSILGLYQYDEGIFDNLELPDDIDRDILITEICTECSDFALLYPDYDFMRMLIGVWSRKEARIWSAMLESELVEYNPIENYDRYETITREVESASSGSSSGSAQSNATSTASQTAFNSDTFKDTGRSTGTDSNSNTEQAAQESSGTESTTSHMHGNIGVTTAAQMLEGYREISNFSTYDFIVNSFKNRFCVQVY